MPEPAVDALAVGPRLAGAHQSAPALLEVGLERGELGERRVRIGRFIARLEGRLRGGERPALGIATLRPVAPVRAVTARRAVFAAALAVATTFAAAAIPAAATGTALVAFAAFAPVAPVAIAAAA
ncbi:MAG: hypothetical protein ACWA6X_08290, partial [Bauldia sp.]